MKNKILYLMGFIVIFSIFVGYSSIKAIKDNDQDSKIKSTLMETYVYKHFLSDDSVKIDVKNGVVTMTGNVNTDDLKDLAEEAVLNIPDVTSIKNELNTETKVNGKISDAWISKKVKLSLLMHRHIESGKIDVNVTDGNVILKGEASSSAQIELITNYAKDIEGVEEVKNEMQVIEKSLTEKQSIEEKLDDTTITVQVKLLLFTHRSTSAIHTKVETLNGVVTINGIAKNAAEKTLVTKLVTDIKGVNNVINNMMIKIILAK